MSSAARSNNSIFGAGPPVLGILRGVTAGQLEPVVDVCIQAGLSALEITLNTPNAPDLIGRLRELAGDRIRVGAGTVRTVADVRIAVASGAAYLVTPTSRPVVLEAAANSQVPVIAGALTPTEVDAAWHSGAAMIKVFPAAAFGPAYLRQLLGPLDDVPLMAVGGVTAENAVDWLAAGAAAIAFGGSIFDSERLAGGQFDEIRVDLEKLLNAVRDSQQANP